MNLYNEKTSCHHQYSAYCCTFTDELVTQFSLPEEGGAGLAGDALADESLAGAGGTEQQQPLGRSADPREDIRPQHRQHDDLPNLQHRYRNG